MSSKVEFELNLAGLNELMKSAEMMAVLEEAGQTVAGIAGDDTTCERIRRRLLLLRTYTPTAKKPLRIIIKTIP